jgi:glutathione S-transferase
VAVHVLYQEKLQEITEENLIKAKENIVKAMKVIDERLKLRTYIVGDSVSVVDVILFELLRALKEYVFYLYL